MLFLQVTDELFSEIATRVLSEEDLSVDGWCLLFQFLSSLNFFLLLTFALRSFIFET